MSQESVLDGARLRDDAILRVLAVDDDRGEFPLIEASFAACGVAIELSTATTGHIAVATLLTSGEEELPHLALVDVGMPLISGFDLAHQLISRGIPTVMMSGQVTPERCERASALGALGLLAKPEDAEGYKRMVRRVLELVRGHGCFPAVPAG